MHHLVPDGFIIRWLIEHHWKELLGAPHHGLAHIFDLLATGLCATVNSDDPAYFGGYVAANYAAAAQALDLSVGDVRRLAANSIEASWLAPDQKLHWQAAIAAAEFPTLPAR